MNNKISKNKQKLNEINDILSKSNNTDPFVMNYVTTRNNDSITLNSNIKSNEISMNIDMHRVNKIENRNKNDINNYFDKIYLINMKDDYEKYNRTETILNSYGIEFKLITGIDVNNTNNNYINRWLYQINKTNLSRKNFDYKSYLSNNPSIKGIFKSSTGLEPLHKCRSKKGFKVYKKSEIKNSAQLGCLLSHVTAIQDAIDNNYEKILILEDDNYYHKNFKIYF